MCLSSCWAHQSRMELVETSQMEEIFPLAHVTVAPVLGIKVNIQHQSGQVDTLNFCIGNTLLLKEVHAWVLQSMQRHVVIDILRI